MMKKKYLILLCGFLCAAMGLYGADYNINSGNVIIPAGTDSHTITGTSTGFTIVVPSGYTGTITLDNVNISVTNCAFSIGIGSTVTLILVGDNFLTSGNSYAGLTVPTGATLIIEGDGSLTAKGGNGAANNGGGAGIGGNGGVGNTVGGSSGTIAINSGTITATGGNGASSQNSGGGAGIGGGGGGTTGSGDCSGGDNGSITINDGIIIAKGGDGGGSSGCGGAGIGGGGSGSPISGYNGGSAGTILIYSGDITATGGLGKGASHKDGAAIGGGGGGNSPIGGAAEYSRIKIITQPVGFTYEEGVTDELSITATVLPSGTPDYQWYKIGSPDEAVGGNSDTYTIPNTLTAGTYQYYCILSATGLTTLKSNTVTVTVAAIEITSADLEVTAPETGEIPDAIVTTTDTEYTFSGVTWDPTDNPFLNNTPYTAEITLTAASGYTFPALFDNATINGETATVTWVSGNEVTVSYQFPKTEITITSVAITVDEPVTGNAPNTTATVEGGANYSSSAVAWTPTDDPFDNNTPYTAEVTLTPDAGYNFTGLSIAKINGEDADNITINATGTVTISYQFPATFKSVSIGVQSNTLYAGTAGSVTYTITTVGIGDGQTGTITWAAGTAPTGVTSTPISITSGTATFSMSTSASTSEDTYNFTVTIDGEVSNVTALVVTVVPVTLITVSGDGGATTITADGGSLQMNAAVDPANATYKNVMWSVVNGTGTATIDVTGGLLAAKRNGTVTVIAKAMDGSGVTGTLVITISGQTNSMAPVISGPASFSIGRGYSAISTTPFSISGTPVITVTKLSGDSHITWNNTTKSLDIAAGLPLGSYPVQLQAKNSYGTHTFNFTLMVVEPEYYIEIGTFAGGSIRSVSHKALLGHEDEMITLQITVNDGFVFESLHVYNLNNHSIEIPLTGSGLNYTFKMPAHHVIVVAVFRDPRGVGIEETQFITSLQAYTQNGTLYVSGLTGGKAWSVYNVTGRLIYQRIADEIGGMQTIPLPGRGIFIVTDGKKTIKVAN